MSENKIEQLNLENMKRFMSRSHPGKAYKITEYKSFYLASFTKQKFMEPIMFNKKGALPIPKSFASVPSSECKDPKLIFESGGKDNGTK